MSTYKAPRTCTPPYSAVLRRGVELAAVGGSGVCTPPLRRSLKAAEYKSAEWDIAQIRKPTGQSRPTITRRNRRGRCGACGDRNHPYMLKDRYWLALTANTGIDLLCLFCADDLMGTPLAPHHFKRRSIPVNSWLRWPGGVLRILPSPLAWMWIEAFYETTRFEEAMEDDR
jgi:hypothetical protein